MKSERYARKYRVYEKRKVRLTLAIPEPKKQIDVRSRTGPDDFPYDNPLDTEIEINVPYCRMIINQMDQLVEFEKFDCIRKELMVRGVESINQWADHIISNVIEKFPGPSITALDLRLIFKKISEEVFFNENIKQVVGQERQWKSRYEEMRQLLLRLARLSRFPEINKDLDLTKIEGENDPIASIRATVNVLERLEKSKLKRNST